MALMPRFQETAEPTLGTLFAQALAGAGDTVALTDGDDALTYSQLRDRVGRFLSAFDEEGLKPGEGIGLALQGMTIDFAVAYIACQIAGLWTTELPPHLSTDVVIERVDATGTRLVIVDDTTDAERRETLAVALPGKLRHVTELTAHAAVSEVIPRPPGEFCAIVFTSGSTGRPKPVMIPSHGAGTHALMVMATLQYPICPVAVVPVTNLLILQLLFVPTLLLGGTVVTVAPYSTDGIINAATRHRASVVFLTTGEIYDLTERDDTAGLSSHIKLMFYGGEPMSAARLSSVTRAFGQVFVGAYGQTETLTAAFLRPEDHDPARPELLSAAGRALVGARIEVRGDAGPVPPGEPGEIAIASPGCMVGYLRMHDETAKTLQGGWVRTGDIGYLDDHGYVHVLDRAKFAFKSGETVVYPNVVTQVLTRHPDVVRAAVVGVPDVQAGQRICAAVIVREGSQVQPEELISTFAGSSAPAPDEIRIVDTLPVTAAYKVDQERVRRLFA